MNIPLFVVFLLFLNLFISAFNAWSVGRGWAESKAYGGFPRFMSWCGAVMSACGFTWCYLIILVLINQSIPNWKYHLPDKYIDAAFGLGYLIIILPVLGSGLAITIQSWMYFWKEKTFKNGAVAGWNSFAQIYNTYQAIDGIPSAFSSVTDALSGDDDNKNIFVRIAIILVALSVIGGILTTTVIIRLTARSYAQKEMGKMNIAKLR